MRLHSPVATLVASSPRTKANPNTESGENCQLQGQQRCGIERVYTLFECGKPIQSRLQ